MIYKNSTNLAQIDGGDVIKQGDTASEFSFKLLDENLKSIDELNGQTATIKIGSDCGTIVYQTNSFIQNSTVTFNIAEALPVGKHQLEIVAGGYVFPSDKNFIIKVVKSLTEYKEVNLHKPLELTLEEIKDLIQQGVANDGVIAERVFHIQRASNEWTIEHTFNKYPSVTIVDSALNVVVGDVEYVSKSKLIIRFSAAFSGSVFLN